MIGILVLLGGALFGGWLLGTPPGILGKADAIGYAICHRIAERSFHTHDRALPLCARCTGTYLGVLAGLVFLTGRGRLRAGHIPPASVLMALMLFGAAYAFDGLNSYLSFFDFYRPIYTPNNTLRLITGAGFGLAMITVVLPVFNALAWAVPGPTASLRSLRELGAPGAVTMMFCAAMLIDQPALRAVLGAISAASVVFMFGVIGAFIFLVAARRDNTLHQWRDLAVPALAGLIFAISVIGAIDLARYWFTGTWNGFTIG
jgi:uncharacterized membrane protein